MHALLDTHALLWWILDDPSLSRAARKLISDTKNTVLISAASAWEVATKVRLGKLPTAAGLVSAFMECIEREGFQPLEITLIMRLARGFCRDIIKTHLIAC